MKYVLLIIVVVAILGILAFVFIGMQKAHLSGAVSIGEIVVPSTAQRVAAGVYTVRTQESSLSWAGKKPFIEGYVNAGSVDVTKGTITVRDRQAVGSFAIDMNTLSVSVTPTKSGQENALEGHLKSARWFDVATHPTATVGITTVTPRADSDDTYVYDITGMLTMKGETHDIAFPAIIYEVDSVLYASGSFEIDRTKWGITSASGSFFDNLADNVIDDMVAISFTLVADKAVQ